MTDANQDTGEGPRPGPAFILVGPQMGENIGAAARAMWNFGLDRMRIVNPRDGWPNPKAVAMASGAGRLLDEAMIAPTTAEACADLTQIFATTARDRAMTKRVLTPERAMEEARAMISAGERVGILFGPERSGLESADVIRSNAVITVPVNPAFSSLNLAQCVLLMAYEWGRGEVPAEAEEYRLAGTRLAETREIDRFVERLVARLDGAGFFWPDEKRPSMVANLDNLFRRAPLTDADVRTLHGVIRALSEPPRARGTEQG
ncbi:RNA methyltransferase [Amaricoccus sp. B4]|uniref:RNA methyltransferase n=1 Tax=Amaricoccus sp. B4 TaxID=3368557 RepID=UPI00371BF96C